MALVSDLKLIKLESEGRKMDNLKKTMTKKEWLNLQKSHRVVNNMNTGTRNMKSAKYPSRQDSKRDLKNQNDF